MLFGGVVDQNVELAELFDGLLDSFSTELFLTEIASNQQTFVPFFFHETPGFIRVLLLFKVHDRNVRALSRKGNCDCAADPAVSAGDDGHFVSQFSSTAMFFVFGSRPRPHFVFTARSSLLMLRWLEFLFLGHRDIPA